MTPKVATGKYQKIMKSISKHPITLLIIGSIITYLLIPKLQENREKREAIAEFELRLVNVNNDLGYEFNELLVLFENFVLEVEKDSALGKIDLHKIQKTYLEKAQTSNSRINKLWFDTKNLRNELYLFGYYNKDDVSEIQKGFGLFYNAISNSILEGNDIIKQCFRNKDFEYNEVIRNMIQSRRSRLIVYDRNQFQQLNMICGILNR